MCTEEDFSFEAHKSQADGCLDLLLSRVEYDALLRAPTNDDDDNIDDFIV
jgi:hypothetical protein